jgi:GrpB-like predicted nucleotidyltransferase (UPF0157 family)
VRIEHVGSTSVPGLAAKPIVDIQVSVVDPEDEPSYVRSLEAVGYRLRVRESGHRMLRSARLDVHVHICAAGGEWEQRHLVFRDHLRRNDGDRALYEATKRRLAQHEWPTTQHYADAKTAVIDEIMVRAAQHDLGTEAVPNAVGPDVPSDGDTQAGGVHRLGSLHSP